MTNVICNNIKFYARQKGLELDKLEVSADVVQGYIDKCITGKSCLTVDAVHRIADVLHVPVECLIEVRANCWMRLDPYRKKSEVYICPHCGEKCYCRNTVCTYRFCPNCGKEVQKDD